MVLAIYSFFRMTQEARPKASWWMNLAPYIAFAFPGSLTPAGEAYRARGGRWLLVAGVSVAIAAGSEYLVSQ